MDHSEALRLKATERYLLNELDPEQLDQFEEHMFDCPECAVDVRATAMFVEQSKTILSEAQGPAPVKIPGKPTKGWMRWLRPTYAVPLMTALLLVIGYQNLISYPRLRHALSSPQVLPWASLNVGTMGSGGPEITVPQGKGFLLFVRIPPEPAVKKYVANLYSPSGELGWSLTIPVNIDKDQTQDQWPVQVPGTHWAPGTYSLVVQGTTTAGETKEVGRTSFDLKIQ